MNYSTRNRYLVAFALLHGFFKANGGSSSDTYIGCYVDIGSESTFMVGDEVLMSVFSMDECRAGCRNTGYSFVGLWGGSRCFCATMLSKERVRMVNNSLCNSTCPGEPTISCGDSKRESTLYSVHSICPRGMFGKNCSTNCNCKDNKNCTVNGICPGFECTAGWMLNNTNPNMKQCSIDVDECKEETHDCNISMKCINTAGSYKCACQEGYELNENSECEEIDQCPVKCAHKCVKMGGSYYCVCRPGYELHYDRHSCVDIDECQTPCSNNKTTKCHQCDQFFECQNTMGSYRCGCKNGFVFNVQQATCEDIDECSQLLANCSHTCTNTNGSYVCGCLEGFELEDGGHHCVVVESGLWSLAVGLILGNAVQSIVIIALAITVLKLLARRNFKTMATVSCTETEEEQNSYAPMIGKARTASVHPPSVYARLSDVQATGPGVNTNTTRVEHPREIREDAYAEIP